jgi:predicted nucleic-acid-binding Zn-ribbon protein
MVFCETCGSENSRNARFCKSCGTSIEQALTDPRAISTADPPIREEESIGFGSRRTSEHLVLRCSLCGSQDFAKDSGRLDSKWGFTSFKVIMLTCKRCGHIELFNKGRSIWDFD